MAKVITAFIVGFGMGIATLASFIINPLGQFLVCVGLDLFIFIAMLVIFGVEKKRGKDRYYNRFKGEEKYV